MDIFITGGGKGIGFELVKQLAKVGDRRIVAISRQVASIESIKNDYPAQILPFSLDLTSPAFSESLISFVTHHQLKPEILINNAGYLVNKPFPELSASDFDAMFHLNVKGPFQLIQLLLPYFAVNAHIVNIGSMGGFQGSVKFPGLSLYSASKSALAILTECLAEELKEQNLRFNCLALGSANTEMLNEAFPGYKAPVEAAEMAEFICNFALNASPFFNGKVIPVSSSTP